MINYELSNSTFFDANKTYCEAIENKLKILNLDYSGFCNAYGYEVESTSTRGKFTYHINYHKHQSTQNGVIIPVDAIDYTGVEMTVTGINKKFSLTIGKSSIRRFFCSAEIKSSIPTPYYIKSNKLTDDKLIFNLLDKLWENKISSIKLRKGKLICIIHAPTPDPVKLISDIEMVIKDWT